jgi:GDPmannose 4,6-dehydratase
LNSKRDWGHAKDYVRAMWMLLQLEKPDDFVIGTGETHSVKEFCEKAFAIVGINITWKGEGVDEVGLNQQGEEIIKIDSRYFRPTEVDYLLADPKKANEVLGWKPEYSFEQLVKEMVEKDIEFLRDGKEND